MTTFVSLFHSLEFDLTKINWEAIAAMTGIVVAVATIFAVITIKLAKQQLQLQSWLAAQSIFCGAAFREQRTRIYELGDRRTPATSDDRATALCMCRSFDELSWLSQYLGTLVYIWDKPLLHAWVVVRPLVEAERQKCGWPEKWMAYENAADKARKRIKRNKKLIGTIETLERELKHNPIWISGEQSRENITCTVEQPGPGYPSQGAGSPDP